jgi:hypothetical protein
MKYMLCSLKISFDFFNGLVRFKKGGIKPFEQLIVNLECI